VAKILALPICKPEKPEFTFELTTEAAMWNYMVLMKKYKGDLGVSLEAQQDSPLGMGLEICPPSVLTSIWMNRLLRSGSDWPLEPLDKEIAKRMSRKLLRL
jgi:hypothetical protein